MPDNAVPLLDVAAAIADGAPIDWHTIESSEQGRSDPLMVEHLRVIAEIAALQDRLPSAPAHTTVVDELREEH